MKTTFKAGILMFAVLMTASTLAFAEAQSSGNAVVNGITSILKAPIKMLDKVSDNMQANSQRTTPGEDVAVSDIYNLDAETTG